jgi:hypothetical protein
MQNMEGVTFCGNCGAQMAYPTPPQSPSPHQRYYNEAPNSQPSSQPYQQPYASYAAGGQYSGGMVPPKNYLTESIIVTVVSFICCCSPVSIILGIIAIVKANNVNAEFESGNINEAICNADSAKKLALWAAILAVVFPILYIIVYLVFFAVAFSEAGGLNHLF